MQPVTLSRRALGAVLVAGAARRAFAFEPESAGALLDAALQQARASDRRVMTIFHASWCGWCRKLDQYLALPEIKPIIDRSFVVVHFTVQEREEKKSLNTPGGEELMKRLGGEDGLPFIAFVDVQGRLVVNANEPASAAQRGGNIGFPSEPHEIAWFVAMLKRAAPQLTVAELAALKAPLETNK